MVALGLFPPIRNAITVTVTNFIVSFKKKKTRQTFTDSDVMLFHLQLNSDLLYPSSKNVSHLTLMVITVHFLSFFSALVINYCDKVKRMFKAYDYFLYLSAFSKCNRQC